MWPQGDVWGIHDFSLSGAQGGAAFRERIEKAYGGATNAADWVTLAQFVNYEGYRAMFEAQSKHRMGLLIWMSHPCWPSFVWQTYDYYFEPTAAYFGAKKASEPLHIQWNPSTDTVEVVNYSGGERSRPDRARGDSEPGRRREVGEDGHGGQRRGQHRIAHQDGVSGRPDGRAFHPPEADARRRDGLRELLLARPRGRQLPRHSRLAESQAGSRDARRASGRPLAADHRVTQCLGPAGPDGTVESGPRKEPATASCPRSTATIILP